MMPERIVSQSERFPDSFNYSSTQPEQFGYWWNGTEVTVRTLSREQGTACRTSTIPIRLRANIPANLTIPLVLNKYTAIGFSDTATRWVSAALNLTTAFVQRIDKGLEPSLERLGMYVRGCQEGAALAADGAPASTYDDSCVSTEFDKLLMAYLLALTEVPPAVLFTTESAYGTRDTTDADLRKYADHWSWGPKQSRFVPNKAAALLVLCTLLVLLVLVALHAMTALPADLVARDTAPWAVLADTADPPAALQGLSGAGVNGLADEERQQALVLSLQSTGASMVDGVAGSPSTVRYMYRVRGGQNGGQGIDLPSMSKA